jgi:hypothetical protein
MLTPFVFHGASQELLYVDRREAGAVGARRELDEYLPTCAPAHRPIQLREHLILVM